MRQGLSTNLDLIDGKKKSAAAEDFVARFLKFEDVSFTLIRDTILTYSSR